MTQDYFETLKQQKVDAFKVADKQLKAKIRERADDLTAAKPLPRYLLRALESGDLEGIHLLKRLNNKRWMPSR